MSETFMSMADARRVAEGRKKTIDDLKKRLNMYSKKKKSVVDDYIKWKEEKDSPNENKGD